MRGKYTVPLKTIVQEMNLQILHTSKNYDKALLTMADVNRPAMQLTGFYNYFDPRRIQIIGIVETTYLSTLSHEDRLEAFDRFMAYDISALIICHGCETFPECMEMAVKYDRNLFYTPVDTSDFQARMIFLLHNYLAPRLTTHGVLVDVYGEGLLLKGDSGIGKSETALELIKRGHRLVADDAVEIKLIGENTLMGTAPEIIRYYMELRGIGVINVRHIYGIGSVLPSTTIDLVVQMEQWVNGKAYDRLGIESETEDILGVSVPRVTIPVTPGRNLAVILELAAMNNRQKKMGFNAAEMLAAEHDYAIDNGIF